MTTYEWITTLLVPVTGIVSWLAGSRHRRNDAIGYLQTTINSLVARNAELYDEIMKLRDENADLKSAVNDLKNELERMKP